MRNLVSLNDAGNFYSLAPDTDFLRLTKDQKALPPTRQRKSLADWKEFWVLEELDSSQGQARFRGDPRSKARYMPQQVTPQDFALQPDSPGRGQRSDGKDLGADVEIVGPGQGYERWKKTSEYQHWLEDSGQSKTVVQ